MISTYSVPTPFSEEDDPDQFWEEDPFDKYLPRHKGFISDFVYYLRGTEIPTAYTVWCSLLIMSTIIKREAWIKWMDDKLFGNLFVILVGPAGVKKSAAILKARKVLLEAVDHIEDPNLKRVKTLTLVENKATPESILEAMVPSKKGGNRFTFRSPEGQIVMGPNGHPIRYNFTSAASIILPEMSVMISKASYAESMIQNLMDLYDTHDVFTYRTVAKGVIELKELYTCLLAATTPDGFSQTIPKAALGDGFISRCAICYQQDSNRIFTEPRIVSGAPDRTELAKRLAWIATHNMGEHRLSKEAAELEVRWYHRYRAQQSADPTNMGVRSRMQVMVRKVALMLKMQRYSITNEIHVDDLSDAIRIIEATFKTSPALLQLVSNDTFWHSVAKVREYIESRRTVNRATLMRNTKTTAKELNDVLEQLTQEGVVKIYGEDGEEHAYPRRSTSEEYRWVECPAPVSVPDDE